jgi:hypothetical protein
VLKLAILLVGITTSWLACDDSSTKSYVLSNSKRLKSLISKSKETKAPFDLSEMFSEHVEDVNQLLDTLEANESDQGKNQAQQAEIIQQISKHMEILQKLLNFMDSAAPAEEMQSYCASTSNQPFHDAICHRPVKRINRDILKESDDDRKKRRDVKQSIINRIQDHSEDSPPGYP